MTGIVKHAENANKARRELAHVKRLATEAINELVLLVKAMYVLAPEGMEHMSMDGKPVSEIVSELLAADNVDQVLAALRHREKAA